MGGGQCLNALRVLVLALALTFAVVCRLHTKLGSPKKEREEENVITLWREECEERGRGRQMGTEFKAIRIRRSKVTCICMYVCTYMPHMPLNEAILMWQYFDKCFAKAATQNPIHFCRLHH